MNNTSQNNIVLLSEKEIKWAKRYMKLAYEISTWTSCFRRHVGAVITVNNRIIATGYNGAPSGIPSCKELGSCLRENSKSGENLDNCLAVHAEQNAISSAARLGVSINNGDIYVTTFPCVSCMKTIIASGIKRIFYSEDYNSPLSISLAKSAGILMYKIFNI